MGARLRECRAGQFSGSARARLGQAVRNTKPGGLMYSKLLVVGALAAATLVVVGSSFARPDSTSVATTVVKVKAKDFVFVLSKKSVLHGKVKFVITNPSPAVHDFAIAGKKSKMVQPGKSTTLAVVLKKGKYPYKCTVDSHAKLGMKGVLKVT
jgi:uncharacterized cupredoxin-like copper-binding protein